MAVERHRTRARPRSWPRPSIWPATDRTDRLGRLLAPAGIRYVVVLTSLAPEISGEQSPQSYPVPADLAPALSNQLDLTPIISGTGITVYSNAAWIPERAQVTTARLTAVDALLTRSRRRCRDAKAVLPGPPGARSFRGPLTQGTLFTASAPAGRWVLEQPGGTTAVRSPSFGWAARFRVTEAGVSTLRFAGGPATPLSLLFSIVVWLAAVAVVAGGRLGGSWQRVRTGRRRSRSEGHGDRDAPIEPGPDGPGDEADAGALHVSGPDAGAR